MNHLSRAFLFLLTCTYLSAQDVTFYAVTKQRRYEQLTAGAPTLRDSGYRFDASVETKPGGLTGGNLKLAGGSVQALQADGDDSWRIKADYPTQAALDAGYPNGTYTVTLNTVHDGTKVISLPLSGNAYPNAPQVLNFTAAQAVNPAAAFTVSWTAFAGGTANDYVQLNVDASTGGGIFNSGAPGSPGSLNGTSTAGTIPAGLLAAGQTYSIHVFFARFVTMDSASYGQGVAGLTAYTSETRCTLVTAGTGDMIPPSLVSSNPVNGAANMPVNSSVSFTFSEPMQSAYSITWNGNVPAENFTCTWSTDKRTLTAAYNSSLPANSTIGWVLNPTGIAGGFLDLAGNRLPADIAGSFSTGGGSSGPSVVAFLGVVKGQQLKQTSGGASVPQGDSPFVFNTFVDFSTLGTGTDVTVQRLPGGTVIPLVGESDSFNYESSFATQAALDAAFPSSNHRVTVHSTDGTGTADATLTLGGDTYPNDPHCGNFAAAQVVNSAASFTLAWDALTEGTATDFIQVQVETIGQNSDRVFGTGQPGQPGALNGTATSVTIPAGTLATGTTYSARLLFAKLTASSPAGFPGATAIAGYFKETEFALKTQGTADTTPPTLVNSTPSNGAGNVPVNSAISFTFSEPMQTSHSISWSGNVPAGNFTYVWSSDQRTFTAIYNGNLPAGSEVNWVLNPAQFAGGFRDLAGNPMASDIVGHFFTAAPANGPDVKFYGVAKAARYEQTSGAAPVPAALAYRFNCFVDTSPGGLTGAALMLPSLTTQPLSPDGSESWGFEAEYPTKSALDLNYPNGSHTLTFNAIHDGTRTGSVNLTGDRYPNAPQVLNFAATQAVDPAAALVVTWNPFTGGTANDYVQFRLEDSVGHTVFESGAYGEVGSLNGTSTTVTVPSGTLSSGQSYRAELMFAALANTDTTGYGQGVTGVAAYLAQTRFTLGTTGAAPTPTLSINQVGLSQWHLHANGAIGVNYLIEGTDSLASPVNWQPMVNFNGSANGFDFTDGVVHTHNFYRVRPAN